MSKAGDLCRLMWKDRCFFCWPVKGALSKLKSRAGRSKNVLQNKKKNVLRGNFKPESFAGSLTAPFVAAQYMKNGKKR